MSKITDYISLIGKQHASRHRWHFKSYFESASLAVIIYLKRKNYSQDYINEWTSRTAKYIAVYEYYGLVSNKNTIDNKALSKHLYDCEDPLDCVHYSELFNSTSKYILDRLCALNPSVSYEKIASIINNMDDAIKILIQQFLRIVGSNNANRRIEEEFLLVEEIEALRKFDDIKRNNSGNR